MSDPEPNKSPDPQPDPQPNPANPPRPPKKDWLRTVARATETVAPLVARQAPKPDELPADTRGRWATVLAIAGILVAVLQFLVQFYDLVTRPLAQFAGALPYLAAALLLAGAAAGIYALLRASTQRQRLVSAGVTLVAVLVAVSWGSWLAYDAWRPPAGYRILISEFQGSQGTEYIDFSRRIAENLHTQLASTGLPIEIKRISAIYGDAEVARREGANQKAGLVIWGWYDAQGVSPHVEVLRLPDSGSAGGAANIPIVFATANAAGSSAGDGAPALQPVLTKLAPVTAPPLTLPSVDLFTQYGADQMTYVASTVLAMSYLANNDLKGALALFDGALASVAGDPAAAQGQEVVYYQRATVNYRLGRYDAARTDLEQAIRLQPDYAPAHLLRAVVLANHCTPGRDLEGALTSARQAVAGQGNDPAVRRLLADLLLRRGDATGALQSAKAAHALDPASIETGVLLASIYTVLDRPADSLSAREAVLAQAQQAADTTAAQAGAPAATGPASLLRSDLLYQLGDAYLALDRYDEALATYLQAQNIAPQDTRLHHAKGSVYYWQGQHEAASAEYTAWAQAAPDDPTPHMLLGFLYGAQGKSEAALAQYAKAVALEVCDATPYLLLGGSQVAAGDYAAASDNYRRALEIDPQNPNALYAAGANSLLLEDYAAAAAQFETLVARQPELQAAHYYLGEALTGLGKTHSAQAAYAAAAALGEAEGADLTLYLAYAYEKLGRIDDSIAVYVRLLAEQESADLHAYLGALYDEKGAMGLARQEYEAALALNPQHGLALMVLGNMAYAEGDYAGAIARYETYLALEESADVHSYAAQAYRQLGDLPAALRHLQVAVRLSPGDADLVQQLATIANWLNRVDEARSAVDGALRLRPDDPALYFLAGQLAYKRCDLPAAVAALEQSVALTPTNSLYHASLGGYLQAQGERGQMQKHVAYLRAAPADDFVAHWLAGTLLAPEDRAAAQAEYTTALAAAGVSPGVAAALHTALGHLAYTAKDHTTAAAEFATALAQAPDYAEAESALGDLAWLEGDADAARGHYRQAQKLLPSYAANYAFELAGVMEPLLHLRLALAARRSEDAAAEQTALAAAEALLAPLAAAAPDWPVLLAAQGMDALVRGDATANAAFDRAVACDQTLAQVRQQIEALVAAGGTAPE